MYRFLLILGLFIALYFLLRSAFRELKGNRIGTGLPIDQDQMVEDPVCHVFVPRGSAIVKTMGGKTYCFCSSNCAATFLKQQSG